MKTSLISKIAAISLCFGAATSAQAITVSWGAAQSNGVADATGTPVPVGDLVLLGSFGSLTPDQIRTVSFATLQANFINYDPVVARHIGDGSPVSGGTTPTAADAGYFFEGNDTNSSLTLGLTGQTVYMWIVNATTLGAATQEGIFTAAFNGSTATIRNNWIFPSDTAIPNTINPDLADVNPFTTGTNIDRNGILIGNFGIGGNSAATGVPNFNLAPIVPEPSIYAWMLGGAAILLTVVSHRRATAA